MDTIDLQTLAARQHAQAVFWTQRDVWLTAACMTLLLGPVGVLFGAAALLAMRGLRKAIDGEQTPLVVRRLRHGRRLVLFGLCFSVLLNVVMFVGFYLQFSALSAEFRASTGQPSNGY